MTTIASAAALLHAALQDLYAGKIAQADRLPAIAAQCADPELRRVLSDEAGRAAVQATAIGDAGVAVDGPENLWMAGVLDDAERDTRMTQPGRLLDIAVIGAVRKAKAAEIVSSETALALAAETQATALHDVTTANRNSEVATDAALKVCLARLAAGGS